VTIAISLRADVTKGPKVGRPPLKKSGAMTNAERQRRWRKERAKEAKLANPKLKAKQERRATRERELAGKILALPGTRYGVIVADPEWRFEPWSRATGMDRAADNHYPTSVTEVIAARDVASIAAADSVLFLWATAPMLPQALMVMAAWGFDYKSQFIWVKDRIGTGYWNRNQHEILLVGTRGAIPAPAMGKQAPSAIEAPVAEHSVKPDIFLEMIESYYPTLPRIELNARRSRDGWDSWGYEAIATTFDSSAPKVGAAARIALATNESAK
jgi:N6-adenosine-specific RNA methylase IME4